MKISNSFWGFIYLWIQVLNRVSIKRFLNIYCWEYQFSFTIQLSLFLGASFISPVIWYHLFRSYFFLQGYSLFYLWFLIFFLNKYTRVCLPHQLSSKIVIWFNMSHFSICWWFVELIGLIKYYTFIVQFCLILFFGSKKRFSSSTVNYHSLNICLPFTIV